MKGTHNIQFVHLQEEYFKTKNNKYLAEIYLLCLEVSANCIKKHARQLIRFLDIDELAHDTAVRVIARYLENKDFKIDNIIGYILLCSKGTIYKSNGRNPRTISLEDYMSNKTTSTPLLGSTRRSDWNKKQA